MPLADTLPPQSGMHCGGTAYKKRTKISKNHHLFKLPQKKVLFRPLKHCLACPDTPKKPPLGSHKQKNAFQNPIFCYFCKIIL